MFYCIYKITNKVNNKIYIGMHQTKNLNDGYMGSGKRLHSAYKKYGIENFEKEILHIFDNECDMRNKEKELVVLNENSYNLCEGGKGGFGYINRNKLNLRTGAKLSEETKKKISENRKKVVTEESRKKQSELMRGNKIGSLGKGKSKIRTSEHNEKIKNAIKQWHENRKRVE